MLAKSCKTPGERTDPACPGLTRSSGAASICAVETDFAMFHYCEVESRITAVHPLRLVTKLTDSAPSSNSA